METQNQRVLAIIGLGNPTARYELTRHNIGFLLIDALSDQLKGRPDVTLEKELKKWASHASVFRINRLNAELGSSDLSVDEHSLTGAQKHGRHRHFNPDSLPADSHAPTAGNNRATLTKTSGSNPSPSSKVISSLAPTQLVLLKPQTYMNRSGKAVLAVKSDLRLKKEQMLIVSDDIDIPFGTIKCRASGGAGTHNGLRSIVSTIGNDFLWLRIGIGQAGMKDSDINHFVMGNFSEAEFLVMEKYLGNIIAAIDLIMLEGIQKTMNTYNGKPLL